MDDWKKPARLLIFEPSELFLLLKKFHARPLCSFCRKNIDSPKFCSCLAAVYCDEACRVAHREHHANICEHPNFIVARASGGARAVILHPTQLPTLADVAAVFGPLYDVSKHSFYAYDYAPVHFTRQEYNDSRGTLLRNFHLDRRFRVNLCSLAEIDAGQIRFELGIDTFHNACKQLNQFEVFTAEMVNALADYIAERVAFWTVLSKTPRDKTFCGGKKFRLLEIGAGRGRLHYFLSRALFAKGLAPEIEFVATDSYDWGVAYGDFYTDEQWKPIKMDAKTALDVYRPHLVLASWPMQFQDWTADIRLQRSVFEYIIIGPPDMGMVGHVFDTWGGKCQSKAAVGGGGEEGESDRPAYEADGFERVAVESVAKFQLCLIDRPGSFFHSSTTSFRRLT